MGKHRPKEPEPEDNSADAGEVGIPTNFEDPGQSAT